MTAVNLLAVCEALTFGAKAGLDLATLHQALTGGAANSWALEVLGKKMIERDFKPAFMVKLQQKDLRLVLDAARRRPYAAAGGFTGQPTLRRSRGRRARR